MSAQRDERVLVTGASGRIGRYVVRDLLRLGYSVRALTTDAERAKEILGHHSKLEIVQQDWLVSTDFAESLKNIASVIHLGAEVWRIERMEQINVQSTKQLCLAAQNAGVRAFVLVSSIAVYGSQKRAIVTEDSPLLTASMDKRYEYRGAENLRAYGRSKVRAEQIIRETFSGATASIVRPTVVVDKQQIKDAQLDNGLKARIGSARLTHFVYVEDVSAALIWLMERHLDGKSPPTPVQSFNLSDRVGETTTHKALRNQMDAILTGAQPAMPGFFEKLFVNLLDMAKTKTPSFRKPLGETQFPADKIYKQGFKAPRGMISVLSELSETQQYTNGQ